MSSTGCGSVGLATVLTLLRLFPLEETQVPSAHSTWCETAGEIKDSTLGGGGGGGE